MQRGDGLRLDVMRCRIVDAAAASGRSERRRRGLVIYRRSESGEHVTRRWLAVRDRYTTDDHAMLTGTSQAGASSRLERLDADCVLSRGLR